MALTFAGFDGGLSETDWARIASRNGSDYNVGGTDDFKVATKSAATLTVTVAVGSAYGYGVKVTNDAVIDVALDSISSGTRWDAVVLRRNWSGTGGTVSVTKITGTSTKQIPAGRNANPGTLDDQVLALVQLTSGNPLPTQVIDMRWRASQVITVGDLLAIPSPRVGNEAIVAGVRWRYEDVSGTPTWVNTTSPDAITLPIPSALVAVGSTTPPQYFFDGPMVHLRGTLKRASNLALGTGANVILATLPVVARPRWDELFSVQSVGNANTVGRVQVFAADGNVVLLAGGDQADISYVSLNNISFRAGS